MIMLIRPLIIRGLGFSGLTAEYMRWFLFLMSFYVVGQAVNTVFVVGIFRSGGDTRFGMILDMGSMWFCSILFGAVAAFVLGFSVQAVYFILLSDELVKLPFTFWRYRQKKWLKNVTR